MNSTAVTSTALVAVSAPAASVGIAKIQHIRSVGRFRSCAATGDVAFKKFTLIFGENARGKTTLCAILRSLQTQQPEFIAGRRTLGSNVEPQVVIGLTTGQALFQNGAWSPLPAPIHLRIFDAHYVAENIYSGDAIGSDQRRNLCRVILGRDGVALANRYDEIDKEISEHNAAIRAARGIITSHAGSLTPDQFVALQPDPEIDAKIESQAKEVEGLKEIDRLKERAGLTVLDLPPLPSNLEWMLGRTLEDVSRDAERIVRQHVAAHRMNTRGDDWISEGLSHAADGTCPFCGQSVQSLDLLAAYRTFFNDSYRQFRAELTRYRAQGARLFADDKIALLRTQIAGNLASADLWSRYVAFEQPQITSDQLVPAMTAFRDEMLAVLDRKLASPLDPIDLPECYAPVRDAFATLAQAAAAYNELASTANAAIDTFKAKADPRRTHTAERELALLRIRKKRFEPALQEVCDKFTAASAAKDKADVRKQRYRAELNRYSEAVLLRYKNSINTHLKRFTAGFHIDRVKVEYSGRIPNSTFCIVINDTHVESGNHDAPLDQPCFKNTLSAGDRSTLALAFFMAELMEDPDKAHGIAVFDDPFSSQDQFRRTCTIGEIQRCGDHVAQVVVMSHDRRFLKDIWDLPLPSAHRKPLRLLPVGKDTTITEWDIEGDTESEDAANRRVLLEFYHKPGEGEPRNVIQKLRPVVETHMRRLAPEQLANVTGLGSMILKIRTDRQPESLVSCLPDLSDINTYTRRYMHGENPDAASEAVSTDELLGFVGKLLEITGALTS
jgi:wobble nucleotide-excising tRNase